MSKMAVAKLKDYIDINPPVKLHKGQVYPCIEMEKINVGVKRANDEDTAVYTGQSCSKFQPNDTIMARITPCLENGKIAKYISERAGFGSTEFIVLRAKEGLSTDEYVYYLAQSQYVRDLAANSMTGASGRQRADAKFIGKIKWDFPDLPIQSEIASILSAYDDLIENNNKRIKLLEQMAENLYKEWFVRFRFPGHEDTEFEDGIPKGWERNRLGKLIAFDPTITVKGNEKFKSIPMAALSTYNMVIDDTMITSTDKLAGSRSQNLDTLLARITPCLENGKTGFVQCLNDHEIAGGSTEFIVMRSKMLTPYFVYFLARSEAFRESAINSMNGADGRQRAKVDRLEKLWWLKPPGEILEQFDYQVKGSFELIHSLTQKNKNLIKQRDLLLPRLMSGKLEV